MPRLPRYEARVTTDPLRRPSARAPGDTGVGALAKGVAQVGQGLGAVAGSLDRGAQEEEAKQLVDAGMALQAEFDDGFHHDEHGLRRLPGEQSYATGEDEKLRTRLAAKRAEILKALPSERARMRFERESAAALMGFDKTIKSHVGEQRRVANVSKLRAASESSVAALAGLDPRAENFDEEFERHAALVSMRTRELAPSREEAEAETAEWRRRAHENAIERLMGEGDTEAAAKHLAKARDVLGAKAATYDAKIQRAALAQSADKLALQFATSKIDEETGWIDEAEALKRLDTVTDPKLREEVEPRLKEELAIFARRKKVDIEKKFGEAHTAYLKGGSLRAVPHATRDWLERHAPDLWARLKDDANAKWRQHKADTSNARREKSQALIDARNELLSMPAEERAAVDLPTFAAGRGLDESGLKALGVDQRRAKDLVERGSAVGESEFVRNALAEGAPVVRTKKDKHLFEAEARAAYVEKERELDRPLNRAETAALAADLTATKLTPTTFLGFDTGTAETPGYKARRKAREDGEAPEVVAKPPKRDRALALMREGKSNAEVQAILDREGY